MTRPTPFNLKLKQLPMIKMLMATVIASAGFPGTINSANAAGESTDIQIKIIHDQFVKLSGTVVGASRTFSVDDIKPPTGYSSPWVSLGTLGLESNFAANCTMDFSTRNGFKLRHTVSNKRLTRYIMKYRNKKIRKHKPTVTLPCNTAPTTLSLKRRGAFRNNIESGIYADVVTITVTTQ